MGLKRAFGLELLGHMIIVTQRHDDAALLHFHDLSQGTQRRLVRVLRSSLSVPITQESLPSHASVLPLLALDRPKVTSIVTSMLRKCEGFVKVY